MNEEKERMVVLLSRKYFIFPNTKLSNFLLIWLRFKNICWMILFQFKQNYRILKGIFHEYRYLLFRRNHTLITICESYCKASRAKPPERQFHFIQPESLIPLQNDLADRNQQRNRKYNLGGRIIELINAHCI